MQFLIDHHAQQDYIPLFSKVNFPMTSPSFIEWCSCNECFSLAHVLLFFLSFFIFTANFNFFSREIEPASFPLFPSPLTILLTLHLPAYIFRNFIYVMALSLYGLFFCHLYMGCHIAFSATCGLLPNTGQAQTSLSTTFFFPSCFWASILHLTSCHSLVLVFQCFPTPFGC